MELIREIIRFFTNREYTFTSKFIGLLIVATTLFCIDNFLGLSFYYTNNQKINQLRNIEVLKTECGSNQKLQAVLNQTEDRILNRKNIVQNFLELFSRDQFDLKEKSSESHIDTVYVYKTDTIVIEKNIPTENSGKLKINVDQKKVSRSQLWHTLSSSYLLVLLFIFLPIIPFTETKFSWSTMLGMIIFMTIDAGIIWLNQFLFGLIPVILNRPWINYLMNFTIHSLFWTILIWTIVAINKKKNSLT